jgi:AcrR family transcriptional regulator
MRVWVMAKGTRRRGRPARAASAGPAGETGGPTLSRDLILDRAVDLARQAPLEELSMVGLAREFGVAPALIHYYVGSRDDLVSGVVNRYFKARVEAFASPSGRWRDDIEHIARTTRALMLEYGGVLRYLTSHNRFRLFQKVLPDETDYGVEFFDRCMRSFQAGGFTADQAALGYHLMMQFVLACAYAEVGHQLPAEHASYVRERIGQTSKARYPGAHFVVESFPALGADTAFDQGLAMLLDGFARWREGPRT